MAGRYVILQFNDSLAADAFCDNETLSEQLGFRAIALYVQPKKFCECPDKRRQNGKNWVKGKRTGLYLCVNCRKPSVFHERGILQRLQYVFGYNQLEDC